MAMELAGEPARTPDLHPNAMEALAYEAPFLIEKLLKSRIAASAEEAEALFLEAKKYIVLVRSDESTIWEMNSLRVDEAWHQFILFTAQYADFCQRFFGRYIHHSPSNAPKVEDPRERPVASFVMFAERYEQLFGSPLPAIWHDERNVTVDRRVLNESAGLLTVREEGGEAHLVTPGGDILMTVNALAREALAFVARTGAFYVRELSGELTDEEKIALVAFLVEHRILRAAA
jgi:hypothetical protein